MGRQVTRRAFVTLTAVALLVAGSGLVAAAAPGVDTVIDTAPASPTNSTTASFTFHATVTGATFTCKLDAAAAAACSSPQSYSGLAGGSHTFSVYATRNGTSDTSPATSSWIVDLTAPSVPTGLSGTAQSSTSIRLTWNASTDNVAVAGYDVFRDGSLLTSLGAVTTYTDSTVVAGSSHAYAVRARDTAGNLSALTTAVSVTPPPDTTIDTGPATPTNSTTASFTFHASASGATFTCKLDAAAASGCTSPQSYSGLGTGSHTFTVTATVSGVVDPTPATSTWTVDLTAPTVPTGFSATAQSSTSVRLTWNPSTDNLGIAGYDVFRDGSLLTGLGAVTTYTDSTVTAGSTHTFAVRARDTVGNVSALTTAISVTTPPDTIIDTGPATPTNSTTASFTFHASASGATFTCKLDAAAASGCTSPQSYSGLGTGSHTFTVTAIVNGVADPTPATFTWTVDITAPTIPTGLSATAQSSTSVRLTWNGSTDNVAVAGYDVFRDGALLTSLGTVTTYTDTTVLAGTTHTFAVRARDTAGNLSALTTAVSATTPPDTVIDTNPLTPTNLTSASFTFHATVSGATFTCKLDAGAAAACTSPKAYSALAAGSHTFTVTGVVNGVADPTPATFTWTVDLTAPSVPTNFTATAQSTGAALLTWKASTDNVGLAGYDVFRDGSLLTSLGTVTTYTDSTASVGTHTYAVRARDTSGNLSALTNAISVTTAPDTVIDTKPPTPTNVNSASFTFHATVSGTTFTCKLDAGAAAACTSPKAYTALVAGAHTFTVYASVGGVNDPTPATATWTIDLTLPTVPTLFTATAPTSTSVNLGWKASTDNVGVAGYDVFRDGALLTSLGPVITYTDTTVLAGSTHAYAVRARDTAGNVSALTTSISVTTPAPLDTIIDGAPPVSTSSTAASFYFHSTWTNATFRCTLDTGTAGNCTSPKAYTNLALGTHSFKVVATVGVNTDATPATFTWSVVTASGGAGPGALSADATSPTSVKLSWTAVTSATRYTVKGDGVTLSTTTALSSTDSTVTGGSTHTYTVTATVGGIETSPSPSAVVTTPTAKDAVAPTTPGNLRVTAVGTDNVTLGFSASTDDYGIVGYFVWKNGVLYAYTEGALTANVPNLKASTNYGFDVTALDAAGNSSPPAHIAATTTALSGSDTTAPAAPKLTATPYSATQVDLSWSKPGTADLEGYLIFNGATQIADLPANTSTQTRVFPATGLAARTSYTFSVRSYDTAGNQSVASSQTVTTLATTDVRVSRGPIVERVGSNSARIVWRTNVAASGSVTYVAGGTVFTAQDPTVTADHNVLIGPLPSSAPVTYTVNGATPVSGSLQTCGASPGTLNLDAVGDMGGGAASETNIANLIAADHPALIASMGDNVYPTGADKDFPDRLLNPYATAFRNAGFFTTFGNHEYYDPGATATRRIFPQPGNGSSFSFDCSGVHFTVVDAYQPFAPGSAQYQWLANDLANTAQPWKVVVLHVPPYSSSVQNIPGSMSILNSLYERYGVQLVLAGHSHNYERTSVINGVTYVVDGGGGNGLNTFSGTPPSWSAYREAAFSYLRMRFSPTAVTAAQVHQDGSIGDSFTLAPPPPGPPDTIIDSAPTGRTSLNTAPVSFYSIPNGASFTCKLDAAAAAPCTSPVTYAGLADGPHTVTVTGQNQYGPDPTPATASWTIDTSPPVFADGFETGDVSAWTSTAGLTVESTDKRSGNYAAEAVAAGTGAYAKKTLLSTMADPYLRIGYRLKSQTGQANLVRVRTSAGASIGYLYLTPTGILAFHNDATGTSTLSAITPGAGWHALELHLGINGTASTVDVWLDGAKVGPLSSAVTNLGTTPGGVLQIGETAAQTYDVLFDDVGIATARLGTAGDTIPPSTPTGLTVAATSPFSVQLDWTAATDNLAVSGYDVFRDGVYLATTSSAPTYVDGSALAGSSYSYAVRARDAAANISALTAAVPVSTPAATPPLFGDGFESGDLSAWTASGGLTVQSADARSGTYAAEGNTTNGGVFTKETLPSTYANAYARVGFEINSQSSQVNLLRMRDGTGSSIGYLFVTAGGFLGFHNDATNTNTSTTVTPGPGWHALELHLGINGAASTVDVWLDGALVGALSSSAANLGTAFVGQLQIGESQTGQTYDVVFDDAAFGTARIGPNSDSTPPSTPAGLTAVATSAFSVQLDWTAATDNLALSGYDIFRDGAFLASTGPATTFTDTTVLASTAHSYSVRARDASGNVSNLSPPVTASTPAAPAPLFGDGFESGDLSAWTSSGGLTVESSDVRSGGFAAEGNTTNGGVFAKQTLPSTYGDAYARVGFELKSQSNQVNLVRMRDAAGNSIGYAFMTAGGSLGFHDDATNTNTISSVQPSPGWHALELHLGIDGTASTVEVWLDGVAVPDLTAANIDLGAAPVGVLQIGESQTAQTYDVVYDDVAFGDVRVGPTADAVAPSPPGTPTATPTSPFSVQVDWAASTDPGVSGYDVFRDGTFLASTSGTTTFTDTTVLAGTSHAYAVRARDASGNVSALTPETSVTTPAAPAPLFADGFESGDLTAWTSSGGLTVESTDVRSGGFAAEGNTTNGGAFAKRTLGTTSTDAYARVAYELKSQSGQVNLLRMRDAAGNSIGYLFLSGAGKLGFHDDATNTNSLSTLAPGAGWHTLELHLGVGTGTVELWVDGTAVPDLTSFAANLGAAPVGVLQVGETQTGQTYDVVYDDAAFGTSRLGPSGDTSAPSAPGSPTAVAMSAFSVQVDWTAATDDVGVTGYDLFRDGSLLGSLGAVTTYTDTTVQAGSTHTYAVRARDAAGNLSALTTPVPVTTPAAPAPLFADGFETGDLSGWTSSGGLTVESTDVRSGGFAAEGNTTNGGVFAKKTLGATYADAYARVGFELKSQTGQVNLLRMRDAAGNSIGYLYVTGGGFLGFHNDTTNTNTSSTVVPGAGWHSLELHLGINGSASTVEVWLDGAGVPALTSVVANLGTAPVGVLQVGETQAGQTYDVVYDDAAFGTARLGPAGDTTAPTAPGTPTAVATSAFSVQVDWTAATDDVGVTGYDVFRDDTLLGSVGAVTTYTDTTVQPGSLHAYAVRARDASGNFSAPTTPVPVTAPAAPAPLFADGFESGDLTGWTSSGGLTVESTDVRSGGFAAEGNTNNGGVFAKRTLGATYADGFARVGFELKSQSGQVNLLRMRDAAGNSIGYLFLTAAGKLGFHDDATNSNSLSTVAPGAGWHSLELHLGVNGTSSTVEVWLDGSPVAALSTTNVDLGTAPVGVLQVGETQTGQTYDVVYDDAAFGTSRLGPTGDVSAPTAPGSPTATATSAFSVQVDWSAATDDVGVTGYDLFRDGSLLASLGTVTTYTDPGVLAGSTHTYGVRARDAAGNVSALATAAPVVLPGATLPLFADGFESGDLTGWTSSGGLTVESADVRSGGFAAEGNTTNGGVFAKKTLGTTSTDAYARVAYELKSQTGQVNLLRMRDGTGNSIGYLFLTAAGKLGFHDDATNTNSLSTLAPAAGWHSLELHLGINGTSSTVEVWLDGAPVPDLTTTNLDLGTAPVGVLQIGETQTGQTYDVVYDDAAFGTARLGPTGDVSAPTAPGTPTATATSAFSVQVDWTAATDDVGVTGYDLFRDGSVLASLGAVTTYTDTAVQPGSLHTYAVRARDGSGNVSALATAAPVVLPGATLPVFSDGFETGDLTAWTSIGGLTVESSDVRSGGFAAEGNTTNGGVFAKKTLGATYADAFARVGFELKSQSGQVNLLRMRDAAGNSIGYLFLTAAGKLAFHDDATNANTFSTVAPGAGWHSLELHLGVNGVSSTVEVWLDGAAVPDLTSLAASLGTAPVGVLQIGETQVGQTYDVVYDDAAFGISRLGPSGDTTAPSVPGSPTAVATSAFSVQVDWTAATDDVGVTGYDLFRDGTLLAPLGTVTTYTDTAVQAGSTYTYAVRARDGSGNVSALATAAPVTTASAPAPLFADGFESGDLTGWTSSGGLTVESTDVRNGGFAAEGNTTNGGVFAKKTLGATYADAYARVGFELKSQTGQVNLLRMRDAAGNSIGYLFLTAAGKLGFHNDATNTNSLSTVSPSAGWHGLELHLGVNGTSSTVGVWLDGAPVPDLMATNVDLGTAPVGVLQIGETQVGQTYDVVYDDAAFGTARLGATGDTTAPSVPGSPTATATSAFSVQVDWSAATDDVGVTGYDLFRDGTLLTALGTVTTYTDPTVLSGSTHTYAVRARDGSGNASALATAAPVTAPAAPAPLFADGFESGNLGAWTTSGGLNVESTDVRSGGFAAEGNTTNGGVFAKKTLGATYADAYARVGFELKSQTGQVNLLRMRDAPGNSIGYLYVTTGGQLAFHNDTTNANTVSALVPGAGWHALELHLGINGTSSTVEVWLDGAPVPDLVTTTANLGTAPIGVLQIGETQTAQTYDVVYDDAAFGTARLGPTGDTTAPSAPGTPTAVATSAFSVQIDWTAATDDVGVTSYDLFRDGSLLASLGAVTTSTDLNVAAGSTHTYAVRAHDGSGNVSALATAAPVTTPAAPLPVFADGFETGDLTGWTTSNALTVESTDVRNGGFAAEGNATNGNTFAKKTLAATYTDAYARVGYKLKSQAAQVNLLRMRDAAGNSIGYLFLTPTGFLGFHNDATNTNTSTTVVPGAGWHGLELHLGINGATGTVEVWLDGAPVAGLSATNVNLGTAPVGGVQIGDTQTAQTYDVVYDDVAFGTSRLGPTGDVNAPSAPAAPNVTATSPFSVQVDWSAATDDVGVTAYDVFRDGTLLAALGSVTTFTDTTVLASSTHTYTVRARDGSGNVSALSAPSPITLPAAAAPVFADGFESGNLSAWTSSGGLTVESTDVRTGGFAAEGNTINGNTFAKKTLGATYTDAYARVGYKLKSQSSQVNLLRMRDAAGNSLGFLFLSTSGQLGFHNDTTNTNTVSTLVPGAGWHALELHLGINGTSSTVGVWLDGAIVPALTATTANLGTTPVGAFQIGETQTARTYDVVYDDGAFGAARLGP